MRRGYKAQGVLSWPRKKQAEVHVTVATAPDKDAALNALADSAYLPVTSWCVSLAQGFIPAKTSVADQFTAANNAWNLVNFAGGDPKEGTTWLFTRNGPGEVPTGNSPIVPDAGIQPFGDAGIVAVLKGGVDAADAQRQFDRFDGFYQGDAVQPAPHFAKAA